MMVTQISLRMQILKLVIRSTVHPIQLMEKVKKKKGRVKATDRMTTMMMVEVDDLMETATDLMVKESRMVKALQLVVALLLAVARNHGYVQRHQ